MRFRSNVQVLFAAAVLIGSLALYGCPKRPEVLRGWPGRGRPRGRHVARAGGARPAEPRGPRRRR